MAQQSAEIVWRRRVDIDKHRKHMRLFWTLYGLPAGIVILGGGVFGGLGALAGLAILLGGLGSMLFVTVWLSGRNERTNSVITREGSDLCWARRRVPLDQVDRFSTFTRSASMSMTGITGSHTNAETTLGTARFVLTDGSEVDFVFVELDEEQLAELRAALEGVLPGKCTARDELHTPA